MASASVKGYLKLASEIAKKLKNLKGKKNAGHDTFVAKLSSNIKSTMAKIDEIMEILAKAKKAKSSPAPVRAGFIGILPQFSLGCVLLANNSKCV